MEKMVREFIEFCFEHGGFLRNHKEFGEMSQRLLGAAIKCDLVGENSPKRTVISRTYAPEFLVAIPPEMHYGISKEFDPSEVAPVFVLVYRFNKQVSKNEYAYTFVGGRKA